MDDEPALRRYVWRVLETDGFEVREAGDGVLRAEPGRWDLVLSDIVMPACNGVELYQRIAALDSGCPVIMSGYRSEQLAKLGIALPCAVLATPFEPERLLEEVRRCLPVAS